jgi:hypothetical protein
MKKLILFALLVSTQVLAKSPIEINGFGSVRAGYLDTDTGVSLGIPDYYDETDTLSYTEETLFGVQANIELPGKWDAVIQAVSRGVNDFEVETKWAYLGYKLTPNHYLRFGRFAMPLFRHSEYEFVGYAHDYATLPKSVYFGFDFNTVEGASLDSKFFFDNGLYVKTKILTGSWSGQLGTSVLPGVDANARFDNVISVTGSAHWGDLSLYAGYLTADNKSDDLNDQLYSVLKPIGEQIGLPVEELDKVTNNLNFNNRAAYANIGLSYTWHNWLLSAETSRYGINDSADSFNVAYYVSLGYKWGDWTITAQQQHYQQSINDFPQTQGLTNPVFIGVVQDVVTQFAAREFDAQGVSVRYEINEQMAFKADILVGTDDRPSVGDYSVASFGIDFIF